MKYVTNNEEHQALKDHILAGKHLPAILRDFHDQKDVFKAIGNRKVNDKEVDWITAQIYAIDHLLWWMAQHGYELKKVGPNNPVPRFDIDDTIEKKKEEASAAFFAALKERR